MRAAIFLCVSTVAFVILLFFAEMAFMVMHGNHMDNNKTVILDAIEVEYANSPSGR